MLKVSTFIFCIPFDFVIKLYLCLKLNAFHKRHVMCWIWSKILIGSNENLHWMDIILLLIQIFTHMNTKYGCKNIETSLKFLHSYSWTLNMWKLDFGWTCIIWQTWGLVNWSKEIWESLTMKDQGKWESWTMDDNEISWKIFNMRKLNLG